MPSLPILSNAIDAARRVLVLERWRDGTLIQNNDFTPNQTPRSIAEAIASNRYKADEIFEVWELFKGETGRDITDDVHAYAEYLREIARVAA